jgi:thiaminase
MAAAGLISRHPEAWRRAVAHPFLDAVRGGTLAEASFGAWLSQDYLFIADLLAFQAGLLARLETGSEHPGRGPGRPGGGAHVVRAERQ